MRSESVTQGRITVGSDDNKKGGRVRLFKTDSKYMQNMNDEI